MGFAIEEDPFWRRLGTFTEVEESGLPPISDSRFGPDVFRRAGKETVGAALVLRVGRPFLKRIVLGGPGAGVVHQRLIHKA